MKRNLLVIFILLVVALGYLNIDFLIFKREYIIKEYTISSDQYNNKNLCPIMRNAYDVIMQCEDSSLTLQNGQLVKLNQDVKPLSFLHTNELTHVFFPLYYYDGQRVSDGGRKRPYFILNAQYGKTEKEVFNNLIEIDFLGNKLVFNSRNGAADALERVSRELAVVFKNTYIPYILKPQTYHYRRISGEEVLSAHSYGIAIDLNPSMNYQYWRWDRKAKKKPKNSSIPHEIIRTFEKNGFIWGGRWEHYDSMHFEYRPEFNSFYDEIKVGWI